MKKRQYRLICTIFFEPQYYKYYYNKIDYCINEFNNIKGKENYFSKHFGDKFFSKDTAKKIGTIRENIEKLYKKNEINFRERAILITSLIYASDKIANTCGHYDAYRENIDLKDDILLKHLDIFLNEGVNKPCDQNIIL